MKEISYRQRHAMQIENDVVRVTVTIEGGHIAEVFHKASEVNPLWTPPWPSMEPSVFDRVMPDGYGSGAESKLLAGILGHNLCMDIFGGPSAEEAAAGMTVHGEASVTRYSFTLEDGAMIARATFPEAGLQFERKLRLVENTAVVLVDESVENLTALDRPIAWTQHATMGPPFIEKGQTQFRIPATRSKVFEGDFAGDHGFLKEGAEFEWPLAPRKDGGTEDLSVYTNAPASGAFTTHLMDPGREQAFFLAFSPSRKLVFGYAWNRADFPWLGIWEENYCRTGPPWNGQTLTLGMEFGVSPMPEPRRQMIDRGTLFGERGFGWIPARSRVSAAYCAFFESAESLPESVAWDGAGKVSFTS